MTDNRCMTARIALVGDAPAPPSLPEAGAGVETRWFAALGLRVEDLQGADGIWVEGPGTSAAAGPVLEWARGAGIPVGGPDPGPWGAEGLPPAFVDAARARAHWREQAQARVAAERARAAAEALPRPYVHQMRGPRHRWWRPLLWALVFTLAYLLLSTVVGLAFFLTGALSVSDLESLDSAVSLVVLNVTLILLVPATFLASWAAYRRSPWRVFSVAGRLRWGWLGRCLLLALPVWVVYLVLSWVVFGQEVLPRPEQWVGMLASALLLTPLQAAAEEVFFRGGVVQAVGAWVRRPLVALVVSGVVSTVLFTAAHGSTDPWIAAELASFAVLGCYLTWRTGGLEAAIALHVVNNVLIMVVGVLLGGLDASFVDTESTGSPLSTGLSWLVALVATLLVLRHGRRTGVVPAGRLTPAVG